MKAIHFTVDYARKIGDLLDEAGFGWRAQARLGVFGSGRHELVGERLTFADDVATPHVLARMAEQQLRPATLFELASAALADAGLGSSSVVVALGSCDVNFVGGSASPAIASGSGGERQIAMAGFCEAWPAGTEFLAIPSALAAGHGDVAHNHLLPIEKRRAPKLVFKQPPCTTQHEVPYDSSLPLRAVAKRAKLRNINASVDDESMFPPGPPHQAVLAVTVIQFNRQLRSRDVVAELAARGLRPAKIREVVALVAAEPDVIATRSIWALGDGTSAGVYKAGDRVLGVNGLGDPWSFTQSFAGVAL